MPRTVTTLDLQDIIDALPTIEIDPASLTFERRRIDGRFVLVATCDPVLTTAEIATHVAATYGAQPDDVSFTFTRDGLDGATVSAPLQQDTTVETPAAA